MKGKNGNVFILLLILVALGFFGIEYYVSNGKPFSSVHPTNNRPYLTYEEHLAQKERDDRVGELKGKASNVFSRLMKNFQK